MSKFIKRATITVDQIASEYFPQPSQKKRSQADVLAELDDNLHKKEEDPRYSRVIFAVEGQDRFIEVNEEHAELAGVFPRYLFVRSPYGTENRGLRAVMESNIRDTLVVADNERMAELWEGELKSLEYQVRRL